MVISSLMFYIEGCGLMTVLIIVIHVFDKRIGMKLACRYEYQYNFYYCCYYIIAIVYASALIISNLMFIQRELITKLFKEVCKQNWGINLNKKENNWNIIAFS